VTAAAAKTMELTDEERQRIVDEEHLRLLTLGHYIAGGMHIAFASLFIFHFAFLVALATNPDLFGATPPKMPVEGFFLVFAWVLGLIILAGWTFGGLTIYAGRCIGARRHRNFCFVMASLNLLAIPVGTVLGVFSLIVLSRDSVRKLYVS
jgi:hypothetical protein